MASADVERIITLISTKDIAQLRAEDFDKFQYQGFDPYKIVAALAKIKADKNISNETFQDDVMQMVAIGMIKGSITEKNITKMSEEGQSSVNGLMTKYGMKKGGGKNQPSNVITFPRVMATFPDVCVKMISVLGGKEFRGGPFLSTRLPAFMQVQVFPAIVPKGLKQRSKTFLLTAALCYSVDQTVQIAEMKNPDVKAICATQSNFIQVGHNSPVAIDATRVTVFKSLSFANNYSRIKSVLDDYKSKVDPTFEILSMEEFVSDVAEV